MIDVRAARNDPDRVRTALARRGAAEAFDALIAADPRWRELLPQVEELRGKQKLQGKPTAEQLEELRTRKERLTHLEGQLAAAQGGAAAPRGAARVCRGRARLRAREGSQPAARLGGRRDDRGRSRRDHA